VAIILLRSYSPLNKKKKKKDPIRMRGERSGGSRKMNVERTEKGGERERHE